MTGPYIYIGSKYVPLTSIKSAARAPEGHYELSGDAGLIDKDNSEFDSVLLQLIAPHSDWECITPYMDEDETLAAAIEPVIAFGLNVFGAIVPVTPGAPSGVSSEYVLRKPGQAAVYGASGSWFGGVDEWLDSLDGSD